MFDRRLPVKAYVARAKGGSAFLCDLYWTHALLILLSWMNLLLRGFDVLFSYCWPMSDASTNRSDDCIRWQSVPSLICLFDPEGSPKDQSVCPARS